MSSFDAYLNAAPAQASAPSFDAYLGAAHPVPASAAGGAGAAAPQAAAGQPPGMLASFGAGLGHGVQQAVLGAQQLLGHGLTAIGSDHVGPWLSNDAEQGVARGNAEYAPYAAANPISAGAGNIGGNIAATAPLAALAPESLGATMLGRVGTGAALGAANGAVTPTDPAQGDFASQKLGQMGAGAAFGGAGAGLTSALGSVLGGVGGAAQKRLAQAGVTMTPGQILGKGAAKTEDILTSVPVVGDMIRNAQQRSVQSFNVAAYNNALAPIGESLPKGVAAGSDAVETVANKIGNVYDSIVPRAQFVPDQNFASDVAGIRSNLAQEAPGMLQQFDNIVNNQVTQKAAANNGILDGQQWNKTRSTITGIARNQSLGNATPDNRALADALGDLNDSINNGVARSSPPDILPTLQKANAAWAQYKQIERAAGSAGASNNGNVFTAAQFANSVRSGSTLSQKATNSGLNGQFMADAQSVLGTKYPDSGTPGRAALMATLGAFGGGGLAAAGYGLPAAVGGIAASLPYTSIGQHVGQALLMARPQVAQTVGQGIGKHISPFAALLGASLANGAAP